MYICKRVYFYIFFMLKCLIFNHFLREAMNLSQMLMNKSRKRKLVQRKTKREREIKKGGKKSPSPPASSYFPFLIIKDY